MHRRSERDSSVTWNCPHEVIRMGMRACLLHVPRVSPGGGALWDADMFQMSWGHRLRSHACIGDTMLLLEKQVSAGRLSLLPEWVSGLSCCP